MNARAQAGRFIVGAMLAAFIAAGDGIGAAKAERPGTPNAAAFLADPGHLLTQNPDGGSRLERAVQELALSDPSTFEVLIGLVANATNMQKSAIAQGLTRAAKIEVLTDQPLAQDWENQVSAITDPVFKTAALDALGDVKLGAVAGAAGGSAGAGLGGPGGGGGTGTGSGTGSGTGTSQTINSTPTSITSTNSSAPVPTTFFTFSASTAGSSGVSTSNRTTTFTAITNSVSPIH